MAAAATRLLPRAAHHHRLRHARRSCSIVVILQLWLLTATMNAYLGGDASVIWPAAGASLACLARTSACCGISTGSSPSREPRVCLPLPLE